VSATANLETYGLQQALKNLQKVDPAARRALLKDMKQAAAPLVDTINGRIPATPPLRGFAHAGRTGWPNRKKVQISLNTKKPRQRASQPGFEQIAVVRVVTKGATVAITDMAGRAGGSVSRAEMSRRRPNFANALNSALGSASRFMWRDVELLQRQAESALKPIIDQVMANAQRDF